MLVNSKCFIKSLSLGQVRHQDGLRNQESHQKAQREDLRAHLTNGVAHLQGKGGVHPPRKEEALHQGKERVRAPHPPRKKATLHQGREASPPQGREATPPQEKDRLDHHQRINQESSNILTMAEAKRYKASKEKNGKNYTMK